MIILQKFSAICHELIAEAFGNISISNIAVFDDDLFPVYTSANEEHEFNMQIVDAGSNLRLCGNCFDDRLRRGSDQFRGLRFDNLES